MTDPKLVGEAAEELFQQQAYNCCESTATAVARALGYDCSCLPVLATGMGGGVGHTGHVCGAVTGGAMALGLGVAKLGLKSHAAEKDQANEWVTELVEAFNREFSYTTCHDLVGIDFSAADWRTEYGQKGCKARCSSFVSFVASWVASRLASECP
ncbi:MAG: C_GCAxxG_C_C family protein [Planctomycetes bacterium]|nr:C_GCAxxG_C_C family protein [Planctomycetota bacterium]